MKCKFEVYLKMIGWRAGYSARVEARVIHKVDFFQRIELTELEFVTYVSSDEKEWKR